MADSRFDGKITQRVFLRITLHTNQEKELRGKKSRDKSDSTAELGIDEYMWGQNLKEIKYYFKDFSLFMTMLTRKSESPRAKV